MLSELQPADLDVAFGKDPTKFEVIEATILATSTLLFLFATVAANNTAAAGGWVNNMAAECS